MDRIVIGTAECPVSSVLLTLRKSPGTFSLFHEAWPGIAMLLKTPREKIVKLRSDIQVNRLELIDVLDEVLMDWTTRVGSGATLRKFVVALEENYMGGCSESLLKEHMTDVGNSKIGDGSAHVTVGKISYDPSQVLGKGSEGTFVYRGKFDGREVAVKRIVPECFTYADREIELLKMSDQHGNVIRYFCTETDGHFRYIALELCVATLGEWVEGKYENEKVDGVRVLKEATKGLEHLHSLKIVHRDVKPANVLLREWVGGERAVRTLISDFGLSKNIDSGGASYANSTGGAWGTEGWIAPEVILAKFGGCGKMTLAVDIFAMGCVYYYVLSRGDHPFGEVFHRQSNIIKGKYRLGKISGDRPDGAADLIKLMISTDAKMRPSLAEVLKHSTFWSPGTNERRETGSTVPAKPTLDPTSQAEKEVHKEATGTTVIGPISEITDKAEPQLLRETGANLPETNVVSAISSSRSTNAKANSEFSVKEIAKRFEKSLDLGRQPSSHLRRQSGTVLASRPPIKADHRSSEIVVKSSQTPKQQNIPQPKNPIGDVDSDGNTELHEAVNKVDVNTVEKFLCKVVEINARNNQQQTPLHKAAFGTEHNLDARLTIMQILIEKGADPYAMDDEGRNFLFILFYHSRLSSSQFHGLCECLVRKGHAKVFNTRGMFQATPLHFAVLTLEVSDACLRLLHRNGVDFNLVDDLGESIMTYAIQGGRSVEQLSTLIELGTDFRSVKNFGKSLLHDAAKMCDVGALTFLIGRGLDVNGTYWVGKTPLQLAVESASENLFDCISLLIDYGADVTITDMYGDSPHDVFLRKHQHHVNREGIMKMLMFDKGVDANHAVSLSTKGSALHSAIENGDLEAVDQSVKQGFVDIDEVDHLGQTLLHKAAFGSYDVDIKLDIIKILIENGADVYPLIKGEWTFLTILLTAQPLVSQIQLHKLCECLLRKYQAAYFNSCNEFLQGTPLQQMLITSVEIGMDTLYMLHHNGVDFNAVDKYGQSVLSHAVLGHRSLSLLTKLMEYGADFRRLDKYKSNLLHYAAGSGNLEALKFFVENGLNVNSVNCFGGTPLHSAAQFADKNVVECVRYLIEQGADKTIKTKYWLTAHDYAKQRKNVAEKSEILRLLS